MTFTDKYMEKKSNFAISNYMNKMFVIFIVWKITSQNQNCITFDSGPHKDQRNSNKWTLDPEKPVTDRHGLLGDHQERTVKLQVK